MSTSDMSLASEHVQRLLQCAVCLERFKQPKILPCQHTFCLTPCLEGLVDRRTRSIRCPECRADHFVPRNGPASFPNNLTVIGFLELSGPSGRALENMSRSEGTDAIHSSSSWEVQQSQRESSPPLVPLGTTGAEGVSCAVCRSDGRFTRCCHCDQLVCEQCRQSHMQQVKADVTRMVSLVRRGLPHITEQIIAMGRKRNQLQSNCECVKSEISEAFEKHSRELKSRERTLREDVETFFASELRSLRSHQENAEVEIASLSSFCDSVESVLSMSRPIPDGDLVEMKGQCYQHLESVQCYEDGTTRPPNVKQIQASLESPFLSSTIGNFGDLIITTRIAPALRDLDDNPTRPEPMSRLYALAPSQRNPRGLNDVHLEVASVSPGTPRRQLSPLTDQPANRLGEDSEARESPSSPAVSRRPLSPSARLMQVRFGEEETLESNPVFSPVHSTHPHRRSRYDRRSDTRLPTSSNGQTISQHMNDRTRHLSLGALPVTNEYDDETPVSRFMGSNRQENRTEDVGTSISVTFPSTRSYSFLLPSLRNQTPSTNEEESETEHEDIPAFNSNSPSIYVNCPRNKYNQKGAAVLRFGKRGSEASEFTWPRGVAVSPLDDTIFVSDSSNHRVQVFDSAGRLLNTFGRYGQGEGEFDCLAGLAINGLGQVIIADRYNHRVQVFDRNGRFQSAFGCEGSGEGQLNYPWGVACDNMGFIYVCDKENHRVQVFQSNGTFVRMFGEYGCRTGQFENPHYIAVSPDNKVYVSDSSNHRVQVFSMYGDFLFSFGTCGSLRGQLKFPRGIAIDNQGFVVVADSGNNRIQIFRADGRFYSMFGSWGNENGQFKGLEGLSILANGNIVVSDRENHRMQIF